jgi:PAS domain S-box-containing protein
MQDEAKTKEQLIIELKALHQRVAELEKDKGASTDPAELRRRAEECLKARQTETDQCETNDTERLYHELETHQVELEMQNEELRNAMVQIEESRTRYSDLYDFAPIGYLTLDENGLVLEANLTIARQLGIERSYLVGRPLSAYIVIADRDAFRSHLGSVLKDKTHQACEVRFMKGSEGDFHALLDTIFIMDAVGEGRVRTSVTDITDRKRAEQNMAQIASIVQWSDDAIIGQNLDGIITSWNRGAEKIYGYSASEVIGKPISILLPLGHKDEVPQILGKIKSGEIIEHYETVRRTKDGREIFVSLTISPVRNAEGRVVAASTIGRDITERKQAEKVARLRLALFEFSSSHSLEELLQKTLDDVCALTNSPIGFYHFVGSDQKSLSLQAWSTRTVKEFCKAEGKGMHYPIDQAGVWVDCVHERRPVIHNDYYSLPHRKGMPEGHAAVIRELVVPIMRSDRVVAILGIGNKPVNYTEDDVEIVSYLADVAWEIALHKRTEESLRDSEERFSKFFRASPVGTSITRLSDGQFADANDAFLGLLGYTREEVIGQNSLKLGKWANPEDRAKMVEVLQKQGRIGNFETQFRRKSGEIMDALVSAEVIEMAGEQYILNLAYDITERKQADNAVLKANRVINALWECNNALIHVKDELQLLNEICRVIVEVGGYRMAWVGYAGHDADRTVTPVARYGYEDGYLEKVDITWGDTERGQGPTGACIRMGAPRVVRHVEQQLKFAPWREEAIKRGYAAVIGLPVFAGGCVLGCLTIYASESYAFYADEVNLLSKLALNLSFGIETLRTSQARKQAEIDLQMAHDELELRVKERTAELEKANEELRQIPSKLISVQEEERKRLASELHDSIGQTLATVKFWVEMALKLKDVGDGSAALNHLEQFVPILQRSIEETRSIYMGLRPSMLDSVGLLATLEWLRQECMKLYPERHIELEVGIAEEEIPENLRVNIFRIAQEALNNIAKHSGAEWVDIWLSKNGRGIELVVSDDGVGMDLDIIMQTVTAKSLGLTSMRERAELTGGSFSIESTPGEGATIRASWPIEAKDQP